MKRKSENVDKNDISSKRTLKTGETDSEKKQWPALRTGVYFTKVDGLPPDANENTCSLYDIVNIANPIASIHFNYCIDIQFLLSQYPRRCRSFPITLIVGQQQGDDLRKSAKEFPNVTVDVAPIPFPYGTHHTKLSLFESEDAIHVVVSTANLIEDDYSFKTQCFYYCKALFSSSLATHTKPSSTNSAAKSENGFATDLLNYLNEAYVKKGVNSVTYWLQRIRDGGADFSHVLDCLVASRPGRFVSEDITSYGHMRLRTLLSEKFDASELQRQKTKIGQFSSIGSLGTQSQSWLCEEFFRSLNGNNTSNMNPQNLKLIYPSANNVRRSFEGYHAGNSLPYTSGVNAKQPYFRNFLHQWKCDKMKRVMPHVKSYTALDAETDQPHWLLITSANLSQAAWGRLEKNATQLFCRSYELGVLICLKDHPDSKSFPLPFDLPLVKYSADDKPYLIDVKYAEPDCHGQFSAF